MLEYKIGETFDFNGIKLKVEKGVNHCEGCYFYKSGKCSENHNYWKGECCEFLRTDHTNVIFKQVNIQ